MRAHPTRLPPPARPSDYRAPVPARLIVPTEDLFAWTLTGRGSLLAHPDDDPRTAVSPERCAVQHLLARGRHVLTSPVTAVGHLLGALAGARGAADGGTDLPPDLPADAAALHARVEEEWEATAGHRRSLVRTAVPDDECERRGAHTLLDAVPAPVLLDLLRWAGADWPGRRHGWPGHLTWPADPATATASGGRFRDQPYLVRVATPTTTLSTAQRAVVRACQDAGLEVVVLRLNPLGDLPCPTDEALGLQPTPEPGCPACRPAVDVEPPAHLLPGERPLPPFLSPGVREEHHDHHLRAHLASTTPARTISDAVAALPAEELQLEAFRLLTHEEPGTSRDPARRHLAAAVKRHRDLAGDPHLAHDADRRADTFRDALTTWRDRAASPPTPGQRAARHDATVAAGYFLALQGVDVLAVRDATAAVNQVLRTGPAGAGDPTLAPRLFRLLSLGFSGAELLQMAAEGTYPDAATIDFLTVLRR